eukprot:scaffold6066_cov113-Skeletonema_marinoi.AAC.2
MANHDGSLELLAAIPYWASSANHNGLLEAVDCYIHIVGYDMVLECCSLPFQIGPHQVTYDALARLRHI